MAWPRSPSLPLISRASKPGVSVGTRNAETPRGPSSLVRAKISAHVGPGAVGDEELLAVEHVVGPVATGARRQVAGVGPGVGLGQPEAPERGAVGDPRQPLLLLLLGAEAQHRLAEEPVGDRHDAAQRGVGAAELLHAEHVGEVVAAEAAVLLRDGEPEEPDLGHLGDDVEVDGLVAVPLRAVRDRLAVEEVAGQVAEGLLLLVEGQVHVRLPGRRRQVDEYGERGAVRLGRAEQQRVGLGPLEVQVGRVLPGHADAAVQLDRLLGGVHRDLAAERRGHGDRDRGVGVAGRQRRGGVAGGRVGLLDLGVQVGEPVLDRLEATDDAAELTPLLEVADRRLERPAGDADLLGRQQPGAHQQARVDGRGGVLGHQRPLGPVEVDRAEGAGHVERADGGDGRAAYGVQRVALGQQEHVRGQAHGRQRGGP